MALLIWARPRSRLAPRDRRLRAIRTASARSRAARGRRGPRFTPMAKGLNRLSAKATAARVCGAASGAQICARLKTAARSSMRLRLREAATRSASVALARAPLGRRGRRDARQPGPWFEPPGFGRLAPDARRRSEATPRAVRRSQPRTGPGQPTAGIPTGAATRRPGRRKIGLEIRGQTWPKEIVASRLRPSRKLASVDLPWRRHASSGFAGLTRRSTPSASQARASCSRWTASSPRSLKARSKALINVRLSSAAATSPRSRSKS